MNCLICDQSTTYKIVLFKTRKGMSQSIALRKLKRDKIDGFQIIKWSDEYKKPIDSKIHNVGICKKCYRTAKKAKEPEWLYKIIKWWTNRRVYVVSIYSYREGGCTDIHSFTDSDDVDDMIHDNLWLVDKEFDVWSARIGRKEYTLHYSHHRGQRIPILELQPPDPFDCDEVYRCDRCDMLYEIGMYKCSHDFLEKIV